MKDKTLQHAAAELKYQRSTQALADRLIDKAKREKADIKAGHTPQCTLSKCAPNCTK